MDCTQFGGTSVSTHENWKNIQSIITRRREEGKRVFLVASALSGISNRLEALCESQGETGYRNRNGLHQGAPLVLSN